MLIEMHSIQKNKKKLSMHKKLELQPNYAINGGPNCQIGPFWVESGPRFYFLNLEIR
jgi:hypothetical protein